MVPLTIYIVFFYKTDFKKSSKEGHFSSFNERMPVQFEEEEDTERENTIDFDMKTDEKMSPVIK